MLSCSSLSISTRPQTQFPAASVPGCDRSAAVWAAAQTFLGYKVARAAINSRQRCGRRGNSGPELIKSAQTESQGTDPGLHCSHLVLLQCLAREIILSGLFWLYNNFISRHLLLGVDCGNQPQIGKLCRAVDLHPPSAFLFLSACCHCFIMRLRLIR